MFPSRLLPLLVACLLVGSVASARPANIYVSSDGNAVASGTRWDPFRTLADARSAVRLLKRTSGLPDGGVNVWVRGEFELSDGFELGAEDGGKEGKAVVYRAWGRAPVRISGGRRIPADAFSPAQSDRLPDEAAGHVLVADLKALGITDTGRFPKVFRGFAAVSELFFNDERLQLARWPNEGWTTVQKIIRKGSVPRSGDKTKVPGIIEYSGERPARWTKAKDLRLHGYWCFDWYDEALPVGKIDPETHQITFAAPHFYGVRQGNPPPRRWRAINLLEELDMPGEYFIDRDTDQLYLWPPADLQGARVLLSVLQTPLIHIANAAHIAVRGFTVENCVRTAIVVEDCEEVAIEACLVRNVGEDAIHVQGGKQDRVQACDVHDTGAQGISIAGGDRRQLIPAGHVAENNHVWRFARRQQTYAGGIRVSGVGNFVRHNLVHDAPHTAIFLSGNDHVVEYNIIHHVCMETDDCGAFYKGRNPSSRGNMIRWNFWHHVGSPRGHGNNAVYFDDGDGGDTVFGNVFFRCGEPAKGTMGAVFSHGGHDLKVDNNVFVECKRAIGASPWSNSRWRSSLKGKTYQDRLLKEVDITKPPYTTRYPELVGFMDYKDEPRRSEAERDVVVMCGQFYCGNYDVSDSLVTNTDPGFVNMDKGNFALRKDSMVFKEIPDFQPIPFAKIGLVKSKLRPEPVREPWNYEPAKQLPLITRHAPKPPRPAAKRGAAPVVQAASCQISCPPAEILAKGQWPVPAIEIAQDLKGYASKPTSQARIMCADGVLRLVIENDVPKGSNLKNGNWGGDAVEIALLREKPAKGEPIAVLRGYPTGKFEVGSAKDAAAAPVWRQGSKVGYAAKVDSPTKWSCAWSIPLADLGYAPAVDKRLAFNITVRKAETNLWQMLWGTDGHSYDAANAAVLQLP
jgi:hypothetical protein